MSETETTTDAELVEDLAAGRTKITPRQIADRYGVDYEKVLAWIKSGELRAINVGTEKRATYLVDQTDLVTFENLRQVVKPPARSGGRRKKHNDDDAVTKYF